jgi:hypothetical protein
MADTKREKSWKSKLAPGKQYSIDEALKLVKEFATAKFNETVDCAVNLGIDAAKSDQQVRGSTVMPHGTGKTLRVAVFTAGKNVELAKAAGADIVGMDDLAAQVKAGNINFDRVIASPDAMRVVGQLGQILGPRGLMPNPKVGTGRQERQGRPGHVPRGQGRNHPLHHRQVQVRGHAAQGKPPRADQRPQQGEAGDVQGHLPAEDHAVLDHGSWCRGRSVQPRAGVLIESLMRAARYARLHPRPQAKPRANYPGVS